MLDAGSGGLLAVVAAKRGARSVTTVCRSRSESVSARVNARLNGVRVRPVRGDGVSGRMYDVIVSGSEDAGDLLDVAADHLRPCGFVLVACDAGGPATFALAVLRDAGLDAEIVTSPTDVEARRHGAVVVRGRKPARPAWRAETAASATL